VNHAACGGDLGERGGAVAWLKVHAGSSSGGHLNGVTGGQCVKGRRAHAPVSCHPCDGDELNLSFLQLRIQFCRLLHFSEKIAHRECTVAILPRDALSDHDVLWRLEHRET